MTTSTDPIIDQSTSQEIKVRQEHAGAITEIPAEPSINYIICRAMQTDVDVDKIERLIALKERMDAAEAERKLSAALRRVKDGCPQILKTREVYGKSEDKNGNKRTAPLMYRFANLEDVKSVVDPRLSANELTYSFDADFSAGMMVTTCTVIHSGGGRRSAKFPSAMAGAPAMNAAQASGSTMSYGQRYSLLMVLGLSADLDDDGRTANVSPAPTRDETQPAGTTREQQRADTRAAAQTQSAAPVRAEPNTRVTLKDVEALRDRWAVWAKVPAPTSDEERQSVIDAFVAFIDKRLGHDVAEWAKGAWFDVSTWDHKNGARWMASCMEACK